jgi:hypothetical protein
LSVSYNRVGLCDGLSPKRKPCELGAQRFHPIQVMSVARVLRDSLGSTIVDRGGRFIMEIYGLSAVGWTAAGVVFLIIWILIAFWPARVARRKGHSFIGYFIFSLIFFPLALITAYLVRDRTAPAL